MAAGSEGLGYILAIDLGTSGPKVGLVTTGGEIVASEFEPVQLILLPGGGAEQDPDEWWQAICTAARRLLASFSGPVERIVAVNCTAQWGGTVAVAKDGRSLMNAIIWLDSRGAPYSRRAVGGPVRLSGYDPRKVLQWIRIAGGPPALSGKDPLGHILFIRYERPEIYRATHKFLEPLDYLNLRLSGCTAASYSSATLAWVTDNRDLSRVAYHDELLRMTSIPREKLADLRPTAAVLGPLTAAAARDLGLSPKAQVVIGAPDIHSAGIGSGAVRDFETHVYLGTSTWEICHVPFKKADLQHYIGSIPSGIPDRYQASSVQETGGACLNFLRDAVFYGDDELKAAPPPADFYPALDRIADTSPAGSGGAIFTPWLYGERSPVEDGTARGGFHNLSLATSRANLVRAVFEGVAFNTRWGFGFLERFAGRRMDDVNAIGGGARSGVWCQILADVWDRTIRQVREPDLCNVRGAGLQAAAALGYMRFDEIGQRVPIAATYRPNPDNRRVYDELFREYINLYRQNRGIYARLNRRKEGQA